MQKAKKTEKLGEEKEEDRGRERRVGRRGRQFLEI